MTRRKFNYNKWVNGAHKISGEFGGVLECKRHAFHDLFIISIGSKSIKVSVQVNSSTWGLECFYAGMQELKRGCMKIKGLKVKKYKGPL